LGGPWRLGWGAHALCFVVPVYCVRFSSGLRGALGSEDEVVELIYKVSRFQNVIKFRIKNLI
jgi:hypothetical protein